MARTKAQQHLFEASGEVISGDPLVGLLYLLMRDHVPPGVVAELTKEATAATLPTTFTNGWLAQYAEHLARSLCFDDGQRALLAARWPRKDG